MKLLAFSLIVYQTRSSKLNEPSRTFFMISWSDWPLKGGMPERVMYVMTPADQMSHFSL